MNKLSNVSKVLVVAGVVAVLIILTIVYTPGDGKSNTAGNTATTLTANSPAQTPMTQTGSTTQPSGIPAPAPSHPSASVPIVKSPPSPIINIITPLAGDTWKIGAQNLISWNEPGKISGSISLIDAATQQFVGIILPQVGPNQTSYTWNTLNISLSRTDPSGKDVVPGTYEIRIAYDGNNIQPVTSPAFTITN